MQVAASMQKETDFIPSYPNLPSKLICMLHNVALHVRALPTFDLLIRHNVNLSDLVHDIILLCIFYQADPETDEVYAQMTLQPVNKVC